MSPLHPGAYSRSEGMKRELRRLKTYLLHKMIMVMVIIFSISGHLCNTPCSVHVSLSLRQSVAKSHFSSDLAFGADSNLRLAFLAH